MTLLAPSIAAVLVACLAAWCFYTWLSMVASRGKWIHEATNSIERLDAQHRQLTDEVAKLGDKVASELSRRRPTGT